MSLYFMSTKLIPKKPNIVCLCGSTKFLETFHKKNAEFTLQGAIVLSVGVSTQSENLAPEKKAMLDELHLRKIDLADIVYVINIGGYVGPSTANEINYATKKGKLIMYLEHVEQ